MPLPDERPRQSVANLIGRFENQSKRQPPTASLPSRSSSVVSHTTGDSAKEETKEKREWPPKSVTEVAAAPVASPPSSYRFKSPESQPEPLPTTVEPPTPTEPTTNGTSEPKPEVPEVPAEPISVPSEPEVKDKPTARKPSPSQTRTPSKTAATTIRHTVPPTAPKAAARSTSVTRTPAKPATASTSSPPTQTLKPQLTGRSSLGKSTVKLTPATPARPKTPSRTTNTTPSRSSGLYAPTAASLARARGAPSPAPTPPKKVVNTNSLDRLSKPTAASLSRARSPAVAQPTKPATTVKAVTSPKSALRGTPGSGGKAPATPSRKKKAEETLVPTSPEVLAATTGAPPHETEGDVFSAPETTKEERPVEEILQPIEPEVAAEVSIVEEDQPDDTTVVEPEAQVAVPEDQVPTEDQSAPSPPPQADPESEHEESLGGSTSAVEDTDPVTDKLAALAAKHDGADIEQIVNLLETIPTTRESSDPISTPPDMQEIPDED